MSRFRSALRLGAVLAVSALGSLPASAETVAVAVAANFLEPLKAMAAPFAEATGHAIEPRPGSTGELYAQIVNGAPYDVFLAADAERPEKLEKDGHGVAGSRFPYAIGRLALWSPDAKRVAEEGVSTLRAAEFAHLALAEPKTAPYGAAARQALEKLGLWSALEPKLVYGQNVSQTLQFVTSGNAELGFVALAQIRAPGRDLEGSHWIVPAELHAPIRQDALLLPRGAEKPAARAFLDWLRSDAGGAVVAAFGYERPKTER